ncbi:MAG: 4-alpha-glucanotransferase [Acetobacteraceae bacterium]|nr:4-alpha-glucanotransferase [Acetobacteraceae bacterium]
MSDEALKDLARRAGVAIEWQDFAGRPQVVAPEVLRRILAGLGLPADTRADLAASRRAITRRSSIGDLAPLVTATSGRPTRLDVGGNESQPAKLELERGGSRAISLIPARGRLRVPAVQEVGYHRLLVEDRQIVLAVAPAHCREVDDVVPDAKLWGLAAQAYALRSQGDGGIGDAASIAAFAEAAAKRGADALALSPLHALFAADSSRFSPYAPSSRLFLNPLHASVQFLFDKAMVQQAISESGVDAELLFQETQPLVDWPGAATAKYSMLHALFELFRYGPEFDGPLGADFARFQSKGGELLAEHARFEALHAAQMPERDWRRWPTDLQNPASPAVVAFADAREHEVLFHVFLQWIADRSLGMAQERAREAGMRIGLIGDMAVGMDPAGSHAWSRQPDILRGLTIGAPPDLLNPGGQDWGLTSFSPRALVERGYGPFIDTIRAVMRNVGGIRVDHAMGLARLWLVPDGAPPSEGAYLNYPLTDLLRLLALESVRNGVVVIGEDLGTVPPSFHQSLEQAGIHGMRVLWFERDPSGFAAPKKWQRNAVAMTSTHDLPTLAGWWRGLDINMRATLGKLGDVESSEVEAERRTDRTLLWQRLVDEGTTTSSEPPPDDPQPLVDAALDCVARTESVLYLVPLEDLLGQEEQPNLPGTIDEHPNWRRRLPVDANDVLEEPVVARRIETISEIRPRQ